MNNLFEQHTGWADDPCFRVGETGSYAMAAVVDNAIATAMVSND